MVMRQRVHVCCVDARRKVNDCMLVILNMMRHSSLVAYLRGEISIIILRCEIQRKGNSFFNPRGMRRNLIDIKIEKERYKVGVK